MDVIAFAHGVSVAPDAAEYASDVSMRHAAAPAPTRKAAAKDNAEVDTSLRSDPAEHPDTVATTSATPADLTNHATCRRRATS
jgi:hypothetical protein